MSDNTEPGNVVTDESIHVGKTAKGLILEHRAGEVIQQRRWLSGEAAKRAWEALMGCFRK